MKVSCSNPTPLLQEVPYIFSPLIIENSTLHILKSVTEFCYHSLDTRLIHSSIMGYRFYNISKGNKLTHFGMLEGNPVVHPPEKVYSKSDEVVVIVYRDWASSSHPNYRVSKRIYQIIYCIHFKHSISTCKNKNITLCHREK